MTITNEQLQARLYVLSKKVDVVINCLRHDEYKDALTFALVVKSEVNALKGATNNQAEKESIWLATQ